MTVKLFSNSTKRYKQQIIQLLSLYKLTERKGEIIFKIIDGKSNKEILTALFIEEGTVKNHLNHIF